MNVFAVGVQVLQYKDELDQCALFLYRKMTTNNFPSTAPLLIQGPPVETSEEYMAVRQSNAASELAAKLDE